MPIVNMFFKSNKIPVKTEEPRLNQDLAIITQMNQEFATSLDLTDTLQNALEVINHIIKIKPSSSKGLYLKSISMSSTMSPGIKIDTNTF